MAQLAALGPILQMVSAGAAVAGGVAKWGQDQQAANILHLNANAAQAGAQRAAIGQQIQTRLRQGRLTALAAASGASAEDPTVQDLHTQVGTEGEYRRLATMYSGDVQAQGDNLRADAAREQGEADLAQGVISGASSMFSNRMSFYNKYAGYGPDYAYQQ